MKREGINKNNKNLFEKNKKNKSRRVDDPAIPKEVDVPSV